MMTDKAIAIVGVWICAAVAYSFHAGSDPLLAAFFSTWLILGLWN